jgi:hypothetical protein
MARSHPFAFFFCFFFWGVSLVLGWGIPIFWVLFEDIPTDGLPKCPNFLQNGASLGYFGGIAIVNPKESTDLTRFNI